MPSTRCTCVQVFDGSEWAVLVLDEDCPALLLHIQHGR